MPTRLQQKDIIEYQSLAGSTKLFIHISVVAQQTDLYVVGRRSVHQLRLHDQQQLAVRPRLLPLRSIHRSVHHLSQRLHLHGHRHRQVTQLHRSLGVLLLSGPILRNFSGCTISKVHV